MRTSSAIRWPRRLLRPLVGTTGFEPATARPPAGCATRLRHVPKLRATHTRERHPHSIGTCGCRIHPWTSRSGVGRRWFVDVVGWRTSCEIDRKDHGRIPRGSVEERSSEGRQTLVSRVTFLNGHDQGQAADQYTTNALCAGVLINSANFFHSADPF